MTPVRTCLGCRKRADSTSLLRCVARNGEVVADASATLPGRGAWVHPTIDCVEKAMRRRAFGRAFRVDNALDAKAFHSQQQHPQSESHPGFHEEQAD